MIVEGGYQRSWEVPCCRNWKRVKGNQTICETLTLNRDLVEADSSTDFLIESGGETEKEIGTETEIETEMTETEKEMTEIEIETEAGIEIEREMKTGKEIGMMIERETLMEIEKGEGEGQGSETQGRNAS